MPKWKAIILMTNALKRGETEENNIIFEEKIFF